MNKKKFFKKFIAIVVSLAIVIGISGGIATFIHNRGSVPASTTIKNGLSAYELAVENGYEGTVQEWLKSLSGKSAYEIAVDSGYKGTEAEWTSALTRLSESNPVGIKTAAFNNNGELVLTLSDDTNINLGKAVGVDGKDGINGTNGKDGANGSDGKDGINGIDGKDGTNGQDGKNGTDGKDGIGITDVDINGSGELVLSFSDEKTVNLGKVVGSSGMNGLSAYEIAVITGKTTATSEAEWIESLKGAKGETGAQGPKGDKGETGSQGLKGDKGDTGATGNDGATPYIKNGNWWIGTADTGIVAQGPKGDSGTNGQNGAQGPKGDKGDKGDTGAQGQKGDKGDTGATGVAGITPHIDTNGNWWIGTVDTGIRANGKSAYEVALENNPNLTYDKWLESLKGQSGENGKSAYELALETGLISSTVSVADWLESLKGADGDDGISPVVRINPTTNEWEISIDGGINFTSTNVKATGEKGADGQNGAKGEKGDKGDKGDTGATGSTGEKGADGISPKIRINAETNEWEVSIDNGANYVTTGVKATGAKGETGATGQTGATGKDGLTPEIKDGIWWIGDKNTGISAEGKNGTNGKDAVAPQIRIDAATNMWEISTDGGNTFVTTNVKATGEKGADGQNGDKGDKGESAFEIAKRLGLTNKDNETAWIESLKGEKGETGATGPQGEPGANGKDGVGIDNITLSNGVMTITLTNSEKVYKFENLKGSDGITPQLIIENGKWKVSYDNGVTYTELGDAKGSDGITPTITDDGYWKCGDNKTSFKAVAVDGENGITPQLKIENDKWYVSYDNGASFVELGDAKGDKGDKGDKGENGISPTIKNGYWYIGNENTNVKAQGTDGANGTNGENGVTPILKIENDYWFVSYDNGNNYTSLNTKAVGEDGQKGDKGTTPLLKIGEDNYWYVSYDNGENFTSLNVKATGANGANGSNGQNGTDGITPMLKIGDDNYWYVSYDKGNSYSSLNVKATGNAGQNGTNGNDGATPEIRDGYWYINNQSTGVKALGVDGKDGKTPYIKNGTWWIGDENTEVAVTGQNGVNGENGKTPEIGANNNWWIDGVDTGKKAVAQDGANGQNGADGDGIVGITVNENNYLVIDMKYGEDIIIEKSIVGADGKNGKDGNGIKSISLNANYELVIETDNGTTNLGPIRGPQGPQGIQGVSGANGLTPILSLDENGNLSVKYGEDGTLTLLGNIKGPKGDKGDKGDQGPAGKDGVDGKSAYKLYCEAYPDYEGTLEEWLASLKGETGQNGKDGTNGKDGKGISNIASSADGYLIITYTDGTTDKIAVEFGTPEESGVLIYSLLPDGTYGVMAGEKAKTVAVIEIPETYNGIAVTQVLTEGFKNLTVLQQVTLPDNMKLLNSYAFSGCTSLMSINIPDNCTINGEVFSGDVSLETVSISDNNTMTYIGGGAFYGCNKLREINIPDACKTIGYRSFYGCSALENVNISENSNLELIAVEAFYNCSSLKSIYIPSKVYQISNHSFYGCSAITTVTIPKSVTCIGMYAFYDTSLTTAVFEEPTGWDALAYTYTYIYNNGDRKYSDRYFDISDADNAAKALTSTISLVTGYNGYSYNSSVIRTDTKFYQNVWNRIIN